MVKRGRYIASNLAYNSKYGVLTEDKPLLTQFLEGAVSAGGGVTGGSDVVGATDPRRQGLDSRPDGGRRSRTSPRLPRPSSRSGTRVTVDGERVLLFRAPVTSTSTVGAGGDGGRAGLAAPADAKKVEEPEGRGGGGDQQGRDGGPAAGHRFLRTTLMGLLLVALGTAAGW